MTNQIKSKDRVRDNGEVYTNEREVKAMMDLVKDESYRIDSKFLEPSCGNGNFLIEILERKLNTIENLFKNNKTEYERQCLIAVSNIYGIDILPDNCIESQNRLFRYFETVYNNRFIKETDLNIKKSFFKILLKNIVCGDGLTGLKSNKDPIQFIEWVFKEDKVTRKYYNFTDLLSDETNKPVKTQKPVLYSEIANVK